MSCFKQRRHALLTASLIAAGIPTLVQANEARPGPDVPEPMVFDLIRPLGVRRGELEVNVLGQLPLARLRTSDPQFDFVGGSDEADVKRDSLEIAPEVEYAPFDDFAVELELPVANGRLEAIKGAAQYTLPGATESFTQGLQSILFHDRGSHSYATSLLYLSGYRFSPRYSVLGMLGFNREFGGDSPGSRTQGLLNATLFAELDSRWTLGLETNYANNVRGNSSLLVMPQVHARLFGNYSSQFGIGTQTREGSTAAELVFRLVAEL